MNTYKNIITLLLAIVFGAGAVFGQLKDRNDRQDQSSSSQQQSQNIMSQLPAGKIIQDGPVDPKEYIVGPGDIFTVSVWTAQPLMFQVPVTPEGTVIIPTVAEVNISGKTLESAKKLVLNEIRKKYISGTASFTLLTPRAFTVTVLGAVLNEGTVIVQSTQRIDAAILLSNDVQQYTAKNGINTSDPKSVKEVQKKLAAGSRRNIVINRKNGTVIRADIEKYLATLETQHNPLLLDGDIIIVQPKNIEQDYVGIYGAVSKEGNYEFVDGDSISAMIRMAGGLTTAAEGGKAILYRTALGGEQQNIELDILSILERRSVDVSLQRGDRVIVKSRTQLEQGGVVTVEGEVVTPGSYPIVRDSTTLRQVITMAGGFTKYAGLSGARIFKDVSGKETGVMEYRELLRGRTTAEDTAFVRNELMIKSMTEMTQADFVAIFEKNEIEKDVKLKDGDKIYVPAKSNAVYVFGEVKIPGSVPFVPGKDVDYYLSLSGGVTEHGETDDMRVIKASTKQWLIPGETAIEEGDYIFVPKEPFRPFTYYLTVYSQVFGIVGTIATLFLLTTQ
ncbi:MAG: polysaccharide biosynthesis/export family protein [Bacteroidota bacterium]